jgi:hypothetical protein
MKSPEPKAWQNRTQIDPLWLNEKGCNKYLNNENTAHRFSQAGVLAPTQSYFLYPFIHWRPLSWFYDLAIENVTAVNTGVQVSLSCADFDSFVYMPSSGIAGSYGRSIFSFLRNLKKLIFLVAALIYVPIWVYKGFSPHPHHPCQHLCFLDEGHSD